MSPQLPAHKKNQNLEQKNIENKIASFSFIPVSKEIFSLLIFQTSIKKPEDQKEHKSAMSPWC